MQPTLSRRLYKQKDTTKALVVENLFQTYSEGHSLSSVPLLPPYAQLIINKTRATF